MRRGGLNKIDREKTCPFLLRMFVKEDSKHLLEDFVGGKVPEKDEIQIYTWLDSSFKELADHIQREVDAAKKKFTQLEFSFIYPDQDGKYKRKEQGLVTIGDYGRIDLLSLQAMRFVIGDYIDVVIKKPSAVQEQSRRREENQKRIEPIDRKKRSRSREHQTDRPAGNKARDSRDEGRDSRRDDHRQGDRRGNGQQRPSNTGEKSFERRRSNDRDRDRRR